MKKHLKDIIIILIFVLFLTVSYVYTPSSVKMLHKKIEQTNPLNLNKDRLNLIAEYNARLYRGLPTSVPKLYFYWHSNQRKLSDLRIKEAIEEIKNILKNNWLWCFNNIRYTPDEGAYIRNDNGLDSSERFVEFGYKTGEQSVSDLERNPLVIALAEGEEQASKLGRIAGKYSRRPYIHSFDSVSNEIERVVCLSEIGGVYLDGDDSGIGDYGGYAFGVRKEKGRTD